MKKITLLALIMLLGFSLTACFPKEEEPLVCGTNQTLVDGECVDDEDPIVCDTNQTLVDGECIDDDPVCETDQTLIDGACVDNEDPDSIAPLLLGITDLELEIGTTFVATDGVTAQDDVDGDITADIVITGTVDTDTVGVYELTYTVSDTAGNETVLTRTIEIYEVSTEFLVPNGDFSIDELNAHTEPWDGVWVHKNSGTGAYNIDIIDGHVEIEVTNLGTVPHGMQFFLYDRIVTNGQIYRVTFEAKALIPRDIKMVLEDPANGWFRHVDENFDLTTEWQQYTIEFLFDADTFETGKFGFFVGLVSENSVATTVFIDNVSVTPVDAFGDVTKPAIGGVSDHTLEINGTFDPMEGVTVTDDMDYNLLPADILVEGTVDTTVLGDYTVTYTVTDESGNRTSETRVIRIAEALPASVFVVANGDFSVDELNAHVEPWTDMWIHKSSGDGAYTATIVDGHAEIEVTNLGTQPYGMQFFQYNRLLVKGETYQVTFRAKADIARDINVIVEDPNAGYFKHLDVDIDITTEWVTYTVEFLMKGDDITTGKFGFFLGLVSENSVLTTIYIDDVEIKRVYPPIDDEAPMLTGFSEIVALEVGNPFDPLLGIGVTDNQDLDLTSADIVVVSDVDTNVAGVYTVTYSVSDTAGNMSMEYVREVRVYEFTYTVTSQIINGDFSEVDDDIGGETSPWYTYLAGWVGTDATFEINANDELEITTTNVGTTGWHIQFKRQGITLEQGVTYKITFDAMSTADREIKCFIKNTQVNGLLMAELTSTMTTYEILFTYTEETSDAVYLGFELGAFGETPANAVITLDNIQILEVVQPTILTNGDMALGVWDSWWGDSYAGISEGTIAVVDGVLEVDVTTVGTASWSPQISESDLLIQGNRQYTIEFDVKADLARQIIVNFGEPLSSDPYFLRFMDAEVVDATTEWTHIVIQMDMSGDTNEFGKLVFELGQIDGESIATTVYIKNVIIYPNYN